MNLSQRCASYSIPSPDKRASVTLGKHRPRYGCTTGDGRTSIDHMYDYNGILYVSGHEFGHILGLADAYADPNEKVKQHLNSPMNGWEWRQATDADYYILLKHATWIRGNMFVYSNDKELLEQK